MGTAIGAVWRTRSNNPYYRISELTLPASASTGLQRFEFKTTLLPHSGGELVLKTQGEQQEIGITAGKPIAFERGVEAELLNKSTEQLRFTVGEFK